MEQKIVLEVNEEEKKIIELYRSLPLEKQQKSIDDFFGKVDFRRIKLLL